MSAAAPVTIHDRLVGLRVDRVYLSLGRPRFTSRCQSVPDQPTESYRCCPTLHNERHQLTYPRGSGGRHCLAHYCWLPPSFNDRTHDHSVFVGGGGGNHGHLEGSQLHISLPDRFEGMIVSRHTASGNEC